MSTTFPMRPEREHPDEPLLEGDNFLLWILDQDWCEVELFSGGPAGDASCLVAGDPGGEFKFWEMTEAAWWVDRRTPVDVEGPLPVAKMQGYDEAMRIVEVILSNHYDSRHGFVISKEEEKT